jgi:hypothetical protein
MEPKEVECIVHVAATVRAIAHWGDLLISVLSLHSVHFETAGYFSKSCRFPNSVKRSGLLRKVTKNVYIHP